MKFMLLILPIFLFPLLACGHKQLAIPPPEIIYTPPEDAEDTDVACKTKIQKEFGKLPTNFRSVSARKKAMKEIISLSNEVCKRR